MEENNNNDNTQITNHFVYWIIRYLFQLASSWFYHAVILEGEENMPKKGTPTLVVANQ